MRACAIRAIWAIATHEIRFLGAAMSRRYKECLRISGADRKARSLALSDWASSAGISRREIPIWPPSKVGKNTLSTSFYGYHCRKFRRSFIVNEVKMKREKRKLLTSMPLFKQKPVRRNCHLCHYKCSVILEPVGAHRLKLIFFFAIQSHSQEHTRRSAKV